MPVLRAIDENVGFMNIAFLFNSDHPKFGGFYGFPIMESILNAKALQSKNRNMRVSIGDILTYMVASNSSTPTYAYLDELCRSLYTPQSFDFLLYEKLEATYTEATVYCWLFQNMTIDIATELHQSLLVSEDSYLGAMDVCFANPIHLRLFRNSLCEEYRLHGNSCSIFYEMSENEDPDISIKECFEESGFIVGYEDIGARRTICDNYDTLEHFKRIEDFRRHIGRIDGVEVGLADDIVHSLEELHPKLFDVLAAAMRTLARAETEEDLAQSSLSGRRVLEKIADYLYPPTDEKFKGRKVGKAEYRNRLWAYIETTLDEKGLSIEELLLPLGKEADRLVELFNSGLHASPTQEKLEEAFRSLMIWISRVIDLSPQKVRKPYLAYEEYVLKFFGMEGES